jgi:hypothetical protein
MADNVLKLFKAIGEDEIAFGEFLPARLKKLAICRGYHKRIDCILFDFGLPKRVMIQCTPTEFEDDTEFGVLRFKFVDRTIQNEESVAFEPVTVVKLERALLEYAGRKITLGMRIFCEGQEPVDILGGNVLATLTVFGWGFPVADQDCEFPGEYVYEPW